VALVKDLLSGTGRVNVAPFTYEWEDGQPGSRCVLAYTSTGRFGDSAIVATVPVPDREDSDPSLWAVAVAHHDQRIDPSPEKLARWLVQVGWGIRVMPHKHGLDLRDAAWSLRPVKAHELDTTAYGHSRLYLGHLVFDDEALADQARALLS
jgi:hypothetical protein